MYPLLIGIKSLEKENMKLISVELKSLDESDKDSPYFYRSRSVRIRTDRGDITTPSRMIIRNEYNARSGIPMSSPLPIELALDFKIMERNQIKRFLTDNKTLSRLISKSRLFNNLTERTKLRLSIFQPAERIYGGLNEENKKNYIEIQSRFLQIEFGNSILTYPYLDIPFSEYKKYVDRYFNEDQFNTIFVVNMNTEVSHFKKVIDYLVSKGSKLIALVYSGWDTSPLQHQTIASKYAHMENIAFIVCQVPRKYGNSNLSGLHPLQFYGFDLVAPKQGNRGGPIIPDLRKIGFFYKDTLSFENIVPTLETRGTIIPRELGIQEHNTNDLHLVKRMIKGYKSAAHDVRKYSSMISLSRVHESINSTVEFEKSKKLIGSEETLEYFDMRSKLKELNLFQQKLVT